MEAPIFLPGKSCNANGKPLLMEVNGELRTNNGKKTECQPLPEQEGVFPAIGQVFPSMAEVDASYTVLCIDANLLSKLASAISDHGCVVLFIPPGHEQTGQVDKPIVALGMQEKAENPAGIGMIVPMMVNTSNDHGREYIAGKLKHLAEHKANMPRESIRLTKPVAAPVAEVPGPTYTEPAEAS
jgi:hypothetical protein